MKLLTYLQTVRGLSRRAATAAIKQNTIWVNDQLVESFGTILSSGDRIRVGDTTKVFSGTTSRQATDQILLFHKPVGYVVSKADPHNPTIFEILPSGWAKSRYPIGRLDKESSGLLVLTNNPTLVNTLLHPSKKLQKVYHVIVKQEWNPAYTPAVIKGLLVNEHGLPPEKNESADLLRFLRLSAKRLPEGPTLLTITLEEGKKRHIRRLLKYLGYTILSLQRMSFGPWRLDDLAEGKWVQQEYA